MIRSAFFRSFILVTVLLCVSCAKAPETSRVPEDPAVGEAVWKRFTALSTRAENVSSPFRLNATLYYTGNEESQRVNAYFWGNNAKAAPYPLRLDILMGPGSVIAAMREDPRGLFIYVPRDETVYLAQSDGLLAFGVPLPFTLESLAALVTGKFSRVFSPEGGETPPAFKMLRGKEHADAPEDSRADAQGAVVYLADNAPLGGFVTLSGSGLPIAWEDGTENGWRLSVEYWPDSTRKTPRKLHIEHVGENRRATLIARELSFLPTAFTEEQLQLTMPPHTRLAPLDGAR